MTFGWVKYVLIFVGGLGAGFSVGAIAATKMTKESCEKEFENELLDLRKHYDSLIPKPDKKAQNEVVTVASGVPAQKELDTHKHDYTQHYISEDLKNRIDKAKAKVAEEHPSEDDIPESDVYEINDYEDPNTGEPGFGQMIGYPTVMMGYYTFDKALCVVDWGEVIDRIGDMDDEGIRHEEDELRSDILPAIKEMEFDREPYDVIKFRNKLRSCDVQVTKYACSSEDAASVYA